MVVVFEYINGPQPVCVKHFMTGFCNDGLNAKPPDDLRGLFLGNFVFKFVARQLTRFTFERNVTLVPENADTGPQKRGAAEITLLNEHRSACPLSPGVVANEKFSFDLNGHGYA